MATLTDETTLVVMRVIKTSPEALFDAWTKPEVLARWWGPEGMTTPEYEMDVRVGGAWRTVMQSQAGDRHIVSGIYRTIERPRRLAFTWGWTQPDGSRGHETVVELTFQPVGDGTRMVLTQSAFETAEQRERHNHGWNSSFNDLERLFA